MITIKGKSLYPGIAIAVAAVVDFTQGASSLPYSILERAMKAVKIQALPEDQPEVVLVTDQLIVAASFGVPGLQKAAIVCESPDEIPGIPINIPCVVGASEAVKKITSESFVIVDGNKGIVIADPDVQTLIEYQNEMEEAKTPKRARVFLESTHLPAQTRSGREISVAARVRNMADLLTAIDAGADSITVEFDLRGPDTEDLVNSAMAALAGKPVTFMVEDIVAPFLSFVLSLSLPDQVTLAFPAAVMASEKERIAGLMELVNSDDRIIKLPEPKFAAVVKNASDTAAAMSDRSAVYMERSPDELTAAVGRWLSEKKAGRLTVVLGESLDMLTEVIQAGTAAVEVTPDLVEEAKNRIREINSTVRTP